MEKKEVLNDYLNFKRTSVTTEDKIKDIERYIKNFLNSSKKDIKKFEEKELIEFLNKASKEYSVNSFNGIKANVKNFIKWFFVDWSSRFRNIDRLCRGSKPPKTYKAEDMLSKEDVEKMVKGENNLSWKVFWLVMFYGGFRPCEVRQLKWSQITFDKEGSFINSYSNKNKENFQKYIPEDVSYFLKQLQNNNSVWVFPSVQKKNCCIGKKTPYFRLTNLSKRILGKSINPYRLRHSIATILYDRDDLKEDDVAQQMGHTKSMKKTYCNLSKDRIRERAKKIWIQTEDIPPEKKDELEKEIKELRKLILKIQSDTATELLKQFERIKKFTK